jgi:hypothetical protein
MSDRSLTVADLLPAALDIDARELDLRGGAVVETGLLDFVAAKVRDSVAGLLQIDVLGLVAQAWSKVDELRALAEQTRRSGETRHAFLGKHDVVCQNRLDLVLEFAGMPAVTDHLQLRLSAKFEGVGVTVAQGCIVAVDAGRGAAQAELRYSNTKLIGRTTDWVELPAQHRLERPIPVTREASAAATAERGPLVAA